MISKLKAYAGNRLAKYRAGDQRLTQIFEFQIIQQWGLWPNRKLNPLTAKPRRYWSQSDEDGILEEIFTRANIVSGKFIEIGSGDGLQNNTIALLSKGWAGGWIDANRLAIEIPNNCSNLKFIQSWVTDENVLDLFNQLLTKLNASQLDLFSLDLDGNDFHFLSKILEFGHRPSVVVLEYNARVPANSHWVMPFNPTHQWVSDDYFGASLGAFVKIMDQYDYRLVACSVQGSNAFFIHKTLENNFTEITFTIEDLYQPPFYNLARQWGTKASAKLVESLLKVQ